MNQNEIDEMTIFATSEMKKVMNEYGKHTPITPLKYRELEIEGTIYYEYVGKCAHECEGYFIVLITDEPGHLIRAREWCSILSLCNRMKNMR